MASGSVHPNQFIYDHGSSGVVSVGTHSYTDKSITYNKNFPSVPQVQTTFMSDSTASEYGKITTTIFDVSKTGFTIRIFNDGEVQRAPVVHWIAIYEL